MTVEAWIRDLIAMQAEAMELAPRAPWIGLMSSWNLYLQYLNFEQTFGTWPEGAD